MSTPESTPIKRFYMGYEGLNDTMMAIGSSVGRGARFVTHETIDEAIDAVAQVVAKEGKTRYVVAVVAKVEPCPPPVKVTRMYTAADHVYATPQPTAPAPSLAFDANGDTRDDT